MYRQLGCLYERRKVLQLNNDSRVARALASVCDRLDPRIQTILTSYLLDTRPLMTSAEITASYELFDPSGIQELDTELYLIHVWLFLNNDWASLLTQHTLCGMVVHLSVRPSVTASTVLKQLGCTSPSVYSDRSRFQCQKGQ